MRRRPLYLAKCCLPPVAIVLITGTIFYNFSNTTSSPTSGTLKVAIPTAPLTVDSRFATDAASIRLLRLISPGLVKLDDTFTPQPAAAKSVTHENFQTFRVKLKPQTFHDGTPLTAKWVKGFYESILSPQTASPLRGLLKDVKSIELQEGNALTFHLNRPSPYFWSALEIPLIKKCKKATNTPCGTGPYKLEPFENKNKIKISKIAKKQQNGFSSIEFQTIKDPLVQTLKLLKGGIDVAQSDIPAELSSYAVQKGLNFISTPSASYTYIGLNLRKNTLTASLPIRQAIEYAIPKQTIMQHLLKGHAQPAQSLLLSSHPAYWPAPKQKSNLKTSKKLLKSEGYENGIDLDMAITTNPFIIRLSQILKEEMAKANIRLHISPSEWGTFYGNIKKGNFESYILTWVGKFQPDIYYSLFHSSQIPPNGANRGGYQNLQMDQALEMIMTTPDTDQRRKATRTAQQIQSQETLYIPLWRKNHTLITRQKVKNCRVFLDGGYEGLTFCTPS